MRKSQTTINIFLLLLSYMEKLMKTDLEKLSLFCYTYVLEFYRMAGYWKCVIKLQRPNALVL